jgi:hypothetical protein
MIERGDEEYGKKEGDRDENYLSKTPVSRQRFDAGP